jgi:hypothetical protein
MYKGARNNFLADSLRCAATKELVCPDWVEEAIISFKSRSYGARESEAPL